MVWTTTPDAATGVAALQTREQDWQETTPHDLLSGASEPYRWYQHADPRSPRLYLHVAPESSAAAVRQSRHSPGAVGRDRSVRLHDRCRWRSIPPTRPPRSASSRPARRWRARSVSTYSVARATTAKVKADLKAAGYNGEKVVVLVLTNSVGTKAAWRDRSRHAAAGRHECRICRAGFRRGVRSAS